MASVCLGRLLGPVGFSRTVAIKRMHPHFAKEQEFVAMFIDEARVAARVRHPNVVPTLDVVQTEQELFLVMDYVHGESLARLLRRAHADDGPLSPTLALPILVDTLLGLEAAHTATNESGAPLEIVHRDVSPQNIMVGVDGVARVFDFGIAKATGRLHTTRDGSIRGKLAYMAPEQLMGKVVTPHADIYAAAVVLWEALAGRRLYDAEHEAQILHQIVAGVVEPPSKFNRLVSPELDAVVMRGLAADPALRFATAKEMARALESFAPYALRSTIGEWVAAHGSGLQTRSLRVSEIEAESSRLAPIGEGSGRVEPPARDLGSFASNTPAPVIEKPRNAGRLMALVALLVLAVVLGSGAALLVVRKSPKVPSVAAAPAASASASAAESGVPLAATITVVPEQTSASSSAPLAPSGGRPKRPPPVVRSAPSAPAVATTNCNPPTYVDAEGYKHVKPGCM